MDKLSCFKLSALLIPFATLVGTAQSAELEGAIQYPPSSVGADAQPPPPARMLPQPVSPWRIELGVSGSSVPPSMQRFYLVSPPHFDRPRGTPPSRAGE